MVIKYKDCSKIFFLQATCLLSIPSSIAKSLLKQPELCWKWVHPTSLPRPRNRTGPQSCSDPRLCSSTTYILPDSSLTSLRPLLLHAYADQVTQSLTGSHSLPPRVHLPGYPHVQPQSWNLDVTPLLPSSASFWMATSHGDQVLWFLQTCTHTSVSRVTESSSSQLIVTLFFMFFPHAGSSPLPQQELPDTQLLLWQTPFLCPLVNDPPALSTDFISPTHTGPGTWELSIHFVNKWNDYKT